MMPDFYACHAVTATRQRRSSFCPPHPEQKSLHTNASPSTGWRAAVNASCVMLFACKRIRMPSHIPFKRTTVVLTAALTIFLASFAHAQNTGSPVQNPEPASQQDPTKIDLDAYPAVRDYLVQGKPARALTLLQSDEAQHENDANYYNLTGIVALKAHDYVTAATAFERVVLMQPENAGAWLDLAIATTETGNLTSAIGYFDYIEAQFEPPPAVRPVIARYRARIAGKSKALSHWQMNVEASAGVDSNANSGLQNSIVPLTLGVQRFDLVLDPAFQARRDNFAQVGAAANYKQQLDGSLLEFVMGARQRSYQHEHDFSMLDLNSSVGLHRPTTIGDVSTWLHLEHLWLGGKPLLRDVRAVAQIERPYGGCRIGVSAESEWRRYTNLSNLDGNLIWGQVGLACDWSVGRVPLQTTLISRIGFDKSISDRAGGDTRHGELIAQVGVPLAWGARAEFSMTLATARDKDGYSPLLESNAARNLDRRNARLLVTVPLSGSAELMFVGEDNRFISNLPLFQQSGRSASVGIRQRF
jgi:hypothetical protein